VLCGRTAARERVCLERKERTRRQAGQRGRREGEATEPALGPGGVGSTLAPTLRHPADQWYEHPVVHDGGEQRARRGDERCGPEAEPGPIRDDGGLIRAAG